MGVAHEDVGIVELAPAHVSLGIDLEDFAAVQLDLGRLAQLEIDLFERSLEDRLRAGVDVEAQFLIVVDAHGVVALDEVQLVRVSHHGDGERALQLLCHVGQGSKRQLPGCFEELHSDVGIRLDLGGGQVILTAQPLVVRQYAVVGQGERGVPGGRTPGVIIGVAVPVVAALTQVAAVLVALVILPPDPIPAASADDGAVLQTVGTDQRVVKARQFAVRVQCVTNAALLQLGFHFVHIHTSKIKSARSSQASGFLYG